jgi:hypothetical protein
MTKWYEFTHMREVLPVFREISTNIRRGTLNFGKRHYAQCLTLGVMEAIFCGYGKIVAAELGVAGGDGLLDLCKAAEFFRNEFDMEILVYGFDTGSGLPKIEDYRDHPEWWTEGWYSMGNPERVRQKLPDFAKLVIGDVGDTIPGWMSEIGDARMAFVSIDLDLYSSTKRALQMFTGASELYLPATPIYFDDMITFLLTNPWCGEELAVTEFNQENQLRKIARHDVSFNIRHLHALHVLDHPMRTGAQPTRPGFELGIQPLS